MDDAWIGVIGGAIGVVGTLAAGVLTQWRSEVERGRDREAERLRAEETRAAEDRRWEREREQERTQRSEEDVRRIVATAMVDIDSWMRDLSICWGRWSFACDMSGGERVDVEEALKRLIADAFAHVPDWALIDALLEAVHALGEVSGMLGRLGTSTQEEQLVLAAASHSNVETDASREIRARLLNGQTLEKIEAARRRETVAVARFHTLARLALGHNVGEPVSWSEGQEPDSNP